MKNQLFSILSFSILFLWANCIQNNSTEINTSQVYNQTFSEQKIQTTPQNLAELSKPFCTQNCNSSNNIQLIIIIVLSIVIVSGVILVCACKTKALIRCVGKNCRKRKHLPILRQQYDVVSAGTMPIAEYKKMKDFIINAFQNSPFKPTFGYKSESQEKQVYSKIQITSTKQGDFHEKIELEGEDDYGQWYGDGSILAHNSKIFLWFIQQFFDNSTEWKKQPRVFISEYSTSQLIVGKWFVNELEVNDNLSGQWVLSAPQQNSVDSQKRLNGVEENI